MKRTTFATTFIISALAACSNNNESGIGSLSSSSVGDKYSYCVFIQSKICLDGAFNYCDEGGSLSNTCPFNSSNSAQTSSSSSSSEVSPPSSSSSIALSSSSITPSSSSIAPSSSSAVASSSSKPSSSSTMPSSSSIAPSSSSTMPSSSSIAPSSSSESLFDYGTLNYGGKTYKTIAIGSQIWMAENLNYDGGNGSLGKCYSNSSYYCDKYGRLYNWPTVMGFSSACFSSACSSQIQPKHQGICPSGWHIPNIQEWNQLLTSVGGSNTSGKHLKAKNGWLNCGPSGSGNNYLCEDTFGFSAMPGGADFDNGTGLGLKEGNVGYWWTSTENNNNPSINNSANCYNMYYNNEYASNSNICEKSTLYSVRCVKD